MNEANMEMLWKPRTSLGDEGTIFTHAFFVYYSAPTNFGFDINNNDDPIMDDPKLEGYNVDRKSAEFAEYFKDMCHHYKTNNLFHTLGDDFTYRLAF